MRSLKKLMEKMFGFGETRQLYHYEKKILDALFRELPKELTINFEKQILGIRRVQRLSLRKEVNIYGVFEPKILINPSNGFAENREEFCLGKVNFCCFDEVNSAKVWVVQGRIFSLNFQKSPMDLEDKEITVMESQWYSIPEMLDYWSLEKKKCVIDAWRDEGFIIDESLELIWLSPHVSPKNVRDNLLPISKVRTVSGEVDLLVVAEEESRILALKTGSHKFYRIDLARGQEVEFDELDRAVSQFNPF